MANCPGKNAIAVALMANRGNLKSTYETLGLSRKTLYEKMHKHALRREDFMEVRGYAVWSDPDFNPRQRAFYYARVIEIPTPRWSTYDAFRFGIKIPEGAPTSTQERAYTSPIWYTPTAE